MEFVWGLFLLGLGFLFCFSFFSRMKTEIQENNYLLLVIMSSFWLYYLFFFPPKQAKLMLLQEKQYIENRIII